MPNLYLIHGYIGAGKTTFSKKLEKETGSFRFTPDEWIIHFYDTNPPQEKFQDYELIVKEKILSLTEKLLKKNQDVILDFGFWTKNERKQLQQFAKRLNSQCTLYAVHCADDIAKKRISQRNEKTKSLFIDKNAYDTLKEKFEPLSKDEKHITIKT